MSVITSHTYFCSKVFTDISDFYGRALRVYEINTFMCARRNQCLLILSTQYSKVFCSATYVDSLVLYGALLSKFWMYVTQTYILFDYIL